ncbi:DNAse I-like superfamily protein [Striga asiatica]|uniref:DNAse I-like superfamily protein n=1 Tax=Striga asiatica TaxID=4170 RepID=A0A5A7RCN2_STRAF|nr:DNAse I-like superfamily protein [Striga asiatica]
MEVNQIVGNEFCVQMEAKGAGIEDWSWMVFVYMSTDRRERSRQWEFLEQRKSSWGDGWVIAGDWNDLVSNDEKRGGLSRNSSSFVGFQNFINNMEMQEIAQKGSFFTWGNNRAGDGYVEERLDKIFASFDWLARFPRMEASNYFRSASDHNVLLFDTELEINKRHKRFQFNSGWVEMEGVSEAVREGWQISVDGSALYQVHQKIKNTRMALLAWHKPHHRNQERTIKVLTEKMASLRAEGRERDWEQWGLVKNELDKAHLDEEQYWRNKSRALGGVFKF